MFRIRDAQTSPLRAQTTAQFLRRRFQHTHTTTWNSAEQKASLTDANGSTTVLTFGKSGFLESHTGPEGRTYRYETNEDGACTAMVLPSGLRIERELDELGRALSFRFNGVQRVQVDYCGNTDAVAALVYPDHSREDFKYDRIGRIVEFTDRLGNRTGVEYDDDGNVVAVSDGNGHQARRQTDRSGTSRWVFPGGASFGATEVGETGTVFLRDGERVVAGLYANPDGVVERALYADGDELFFEYQDRRLLKTGASSAGTVRFDWKDGRILQEEQAGLYVANALDGAGKWVGTIYPDESQVRFAFDREFRLAEVIDWNGGRQTLTYQPDDRKTERVLPSGLREITEWTQGGHLASSIAMLQSGRGDAVFALRLDYDSEDRPFMLVDSTFGAREYAYDALGRVRSAKGARRGQSEGFQYDPAGNWKTANGLTAECNEANQLLSFGKTKFTYDARGNLVKAEGSSQAWTYHYNLRNQLVRAEGQGGVAVEFGYDVLGRRLWKRCGKRTVQYAWLGDQLLHEVESEFPVVTRRDYAYLPGSPNPLAVRVNGHVYFYHNDYRGAPHRLTDAHSQVVWMADYSVFGEARVEMALVRNDLRLPGQQYDEETGLHYNRFRYYSPIWGRYLTRDPLGFGGGVHLYAYTRNRPTLCVDPLGLADSGPGGGGGAGGKGGVTLQGGVTKSVKKDPAVQKGGGGGGGHGGKPGGGGGGKYDPGSLEPDLGDKIILTIDKYVYPDVTMQDWYDTYDVFYNFFPNIWGGGISLIASRLMGPKLGGALGGGFSGLTTQLGKEMDPRVDHSKTNPLQAAGRLLGQTSLSAGVGYATGGIPQIGKFSPVANGLANAAVNAGVNGAGNVVTSAGNRVINGGLGEAKLGENAANDFGAGAAASLVVSGAGPLIGSATKNLKSGLKPGPASTAPPGAKTGSGVVYGNQGGANPLGPAASAPAGVKTGSGAVYGNQGGADPLGGPANKGGAPAATTPHGVAPAAPPAPLSPAASQAAKAMAAQAKLEKDLAAATASFDKEMANAAGYNAQQAANAKYASAVDAANAAYKKTMTGP